MAGNIFFCMPIFIWFELKFDVLEVKDQIFLEALKKIYHQVSSAPDNLSPDEVRRLSSNLTKEAFSNVNFQILGSENLPYESNCIFIYNHLQNHPDYTEADEFQITLDSHFISGLILDKYYKKPGNRVARFSLPSESNHKAYYDRLGFIRVYAKDFTPEHLEKKEIRGINQQFYSKAIESLEGGSGLVFSPEGSSYSTEESPGSFRHGIFKLACRMIPQPLIVPLVMANFDKLASETTFKCQIKTPFRMSDFTILDENDEYFPRIVEKINQQYTIWVKDLMLEENDFRGEIRDLKKKIQNKEDKTDLVVFYGSSTIRLWKNLDEYFPKHNILNLGFGGAYIDSLEQYFESLFQFESPKIIVMYLGGNDLSLGYSSDKIVEMIRGFIARVNKKFPQAIIINIGIKPSFERHKNLETIKRINQMMEMHAIENNHLIQIDLFKALLKDGQIGQEYYLKDGLHLNENGYLVLNTLLKKTLRAVENLVWISVLSKSLHLFHHNGD